MQWFKKLLLAGLLTLGFIGAVPAMASAYLHEAQANDKASVNSWNVFCRGSTNVCRNFPYPYSGATRVNSDTVDTYITVYRWAYGQCYRRVRVTGNDYDSRVMEGQSGYWTCY